MMSVLRPRSPGHWEIEMVGQGCFRVVELKSLWKGGGGRVCVPQSPGRGQQQDKCECTGLEAQVFGVGNGGKSVYRP